MTDHDGPSHLDIQQDYFTAVATDHGVNESANADKMSVLERLTPPPSTHPEVLECGAGGGFYTRRFLAAGYRVVGVDLSAEALAVNVRQAEEIGKEDVLEVHTGDFATVARRLDRDFDIVLFIKVLHHFENLTAIYDALDAGLERLRPGGALVVFEPNGRNPLWRPFYMLQKDPATGRSKWYYEQNTSLITARNLSRHLDSIGVQYQVAFHYVIPAMLLRRRILGFGIPSSVNDWLEGTPVARWAANLSIVVRV